jgi:hypothetical protein
MRFLHVPVRTGTNQPASTSVVSEGHSNVRKRTICRAGLAQCIRFREFGVYGGSKVSDTAKAKSAKSTSFTNSLQLSYNKGPSWGEFLCKDKTAFLVSGIRCRTDANR